MKKIYHQLEMYEELEHFGKNGSGMTDNHKKESKPYSSLKRKSKLKQHTTIYPLSTARSQRSEICFNTYSINAWGNRPIEIMIYPYNAAV